MCPLPLNFKIRQPTISDTEGILFTIFHIVPITVLLIIVFLNYSITLCAIGWFFNNKAAATSFPMLQQNRLFDIN